MRLSTWFFILAAWLAGCTVVAVVAHTPIAGLTVIGAGLFVLAGNDARQDGC